MARVDVNISITDEQLPHFAEIVASLRAAGLEVTSTSPSLGFVSGTIDSSKLPDLQQIDGIDAVEADRDVGIPPGEN
jgi:hypothetical protein